MRTLKERIKNFKMPHTYVILVPQSQKKSDKVCGLWH